MRKITFYKRAAGRCPVPGHLGDLPDKLDDLEKYIEKRKKRAPAFARGFEAGYEHFKIGAMLRQAREEAGITQEELARRLQTKKSAISRIENHAEDIKLSTLERAAEAMGKRLTLKIA